MPRKALPFWGRVARSGRDDCWPWSGYIDDSGYGVVRHGGRMQKTHRVAYSLAVGEIPEGMVVMHRCDNPPCCNPAHLSVGTFAENNRDRHVKGRSRGLFRGDATHPATRRAGERHWQAKLTARHVREIRERSADGETRATLAIEFGVNAATISRIARGVWRKEVV